MADIKNVPHRELQAQWHEDYAHHLRTGEPMSTWQVKDTEGSWQDLTFDPLWDRKISYRKKPKIVKVWDWFIEYKDGSILKQTGRLEDFPNFFQISLAQKINGTEREVEI